MSIKIARKLWPRSMWINGDGPYASISSCRGTTVLLCRTRMDAEIAKVTIDHTACGGGCRGAHKIVYIGAGEGDAPIPREEVIAFMRRKPAATA